MIILERSNGNTWEIVYSKGNLENSELLSDFLNAMHRLWKCVVLVNLSVERDDTNSNLYEYVFTTNDGRTWQQTFLVEDGDFRQTFRVLPSGFIQDEIRCVVDVTDCILKMVLIHDLDKLEFRWE